MQCRQSLILALGLLGGAAGCANMLPSWTSDSAAAAKPPVEKEKLYKPSTYVTLGDFRGEASFAKETPSGLRQQYREEAKLAYLKAIEVDPKYLPAYSGLARLQQKCEDYAGAAAVYDRALQINPRDHAIWFERAVCQCRAKNFTAAVDDLRKACELDPANRQYSTTLGYTLARAGRYDESFTILARDSGEAKAHGDLGGMLLHLNQPELARQQALLAFDKDPSQQAAQSLLAALADKAAEPDAMQPASYTQPAATQPASYTQPTVIQHTVYSQPAVPSQPSVYPQPAVIQPSTYPQPAVIQSSVYTQPAAPTQPMPIQPMPAAPANFPLAEAAQAQPINVPPQPAISIPQKN